MLFLALMAMVVGWLVDITPEMPTPPAAMEAGPGLLAQLIAQANQLCMWVDFPVAGVVFMTTSAVWLAGLVLRLARILFGFFIG